MINNHLSDFDFNRLSSFISNNYGIKLPITKKVMLQARLQKRLADNNIASFKEYCDFVLSEKSTDSEIIHMIDVVSTNKTDFFRESTHFDFMKSDILPEFLQNRPGETLKVWSAASSSGEEAYTIAMVISDFKDNKLGFDYSILGTDVSSRIIEKAMLGVYSMERVSTISLNLKQKYLLRNKNPEKKDVLIVPELRKNTKFQRLNLMDDFYNVPKDFDVIFCRNVLIYFDRVTQEKVINKLCSHLKPNGYFFLGHSESIMGINVPLRQIKPTIFQKI
jgi:chemotaxis protein methyltransferase CheR